MALSAKGSNAFGIQNKDINFDHENGITTKVYHGATIRLTNNDIVGRIQSWQPVQYSRAGSSVREVSKNTWGRPIDWVPGIVEDHTLTVVRTEVWREELELALGFGALFEDLADQTEPFTIDEVLQRGSVIERKWRYFGCWFTERNENEYAADGDGKVVVNATVAYVWRRLQP